MNQYDETKIAMTADVVAAHVSNNSVAISDIAKLITGVHAAFAGLGAQTTVAAIHQEPAVPIRNSVKPDYIVCLEDGKKLKLLRRHLRVSFNLSPDEYRTKWGLPASYPMVAPNYAERRRELAVTNGLGRKPGQRVKT